MVFRDDFPDLTGEEWELAMDGAGHDVTAHLRERGFCERCDDRVPPRVTAPGA